MSRNPGYSRAGPNGGGYANGNAGYNNGTYGSYNGSVNSLDERPSGERPRRPGGYGGMAPVEDDYTRRPSNDSARERRPGGYGGLAREDDLDRRGSPDRPRRPAGYGGMQGREGSPSQVTRPTSLERTKANRRSGERQYAGSRPGANYGPGSQRIEEVLKYIEQKWDFMTKDRCVPIEVALKLMDSSSLGLANQAGQFRQTHDELQQALKGIVNGRSWLDAATSTLLTIARASSGLQQFNWYLSSNPKQSSKLAASRSQSQKFTCCG